MSWFCFFFFIISPILIPKTFFFQTSCTYMNYWCVEIKIWAVACIWASSPIRYVTFRERKWESYLERRSMETEVLKEELESGRAAFWICGQCFLFLLDMDVGSCLCWRSVEAGGRTGCLCGCFGGSFSIPVSGRLLLKQWVFHSPE